ncbi:hypothetical protein CCACVL1_15995 [Corchorus capsularis]|uniref:Uncharacterized protein n=1 Tax=Corchorus capsularis TaxID=210143 RepID=A0A1R3I004_COCAP|nr:hypothetical protein CCACVL1_15995 [Corchorus capsularis]
MGLKATDGPAEAVKTSFLVYRGSFNTLYRPSAIVPNNPNGLIKPAPIKSPVNSQAI